LAPIAAIGGCLEEVFRVCLFRGRQPDASHLVQPLCMRAAVLVEAIKELQVANAEAIKELKYENGILKQRIAAVEGRSR
jgi:hypothetical protein